MRAAFLSLIFGSFNLSAQLTVTTTAGGFFPSGTPAQNAAIRTGGTISGSPAGAIVFSTGALLQQVDAAGNIGTLAGTGETGYSGDGGPALQAKLTHAGSPRFDKAGNLYFYDGYRIRRIDLEGTITTILGTGIPGTLGANGPLALAQVQLIYDLEFDSAGNLYLVEPNQIRRVTPAGKLEVFAAGVGGGAATIDSADNLYVFNGAQVYRVSPDGTIRMVAGYGSTGIRTFSSISAATSDAMGNLYAIEGSNSSIWLIDQGGGISPLFQGTVDLGGDSALTTLLAIGRGSDGAIYFVDGIRLRRLNSPSSVRTVAGKDFGPAPDGTPAAMASLDSPGSLAISRAGDLYFMEGCSVRKVGANGLLNTAGTFDSCLVNTTLAADSKGKLYTPGLDHTVSPPKEGILALSPEGITSVVPGSTALGILGADATVAVDSTDRLYILAPTGLHRWTPVGGIENLGWDNKLPSEAVGDRMSIDASDNLYLEDEKTLQVFKFTPDGLSAVIASYPSLPALVTLPFAADPSGRIWTSFTAAPLPVPLSSNAPGVGVLGMSDITEVIPCCGDSGDGGPAASARMNVLNSIAISPSGEIYMLTDSAIRKISGAIPSSPPQISPAGVVNALSYQSGSVSPGELISIFGAGFGQNSVQSFVPEDNTVPISLANVAVFFNGLHGNITAIAPGQINVFVPYEIAGSQTVSIKVVVDGAASNLVVIPTASSVFGLATADASGFGQGAILNQDGTLNSASNPAAPGSIIVLYGTGAGVTTPALPDGALSLSAPFPVPAAPVTVTIGGEAAEVLYAGDAPSLATGVLQINARIPADILAGNIPIRISVAGVATSQIVTCAVQ
jgi:uncharacterized protein (TIGR03437 family)